MRFDFYSRPEYFAELTRCARQAGPGDSITLLTMVLDPDIKPVVTLLEALADAAGRGAKIRFMTDAYSFLLNEHDRPGPLLMHAKIVPETVSGTFAQVYGLLENLRKRGGEYYIINQPAHRFSFPKAGRSHIKLALVNDRVFITGCNLDDESYLDLTVSWQDAETADLLRIFVEQVASAGTVKRALGNLDQTFTIGDERIIFVDSGVRNQSVILQQAYELIDEAAEYIVITCQFFPGGETAQRLLAAHKRGVKVSIYFSPPHIHGLDAPGHWLYNLRERLRLPPEFFVNQLPAGTPRLHAKLIATDKGAMIGSHNYIRPGVALGTAEIALLVPDPDFSRQAVEKMTAVIAEVRPS